MSKKNALAFAAGFGGAYLKGKERQQDRERQDKLDARDDEKHAAWQSEQADKQTMRTSLADAIKPTTVDAGYQVTDSAGSNAFTKDADAAAMMSDMVEDQRPSLGQAYRSAGNTFADRKGAETAATEYNSPPAMLDRMSTAVAPMDPAKSLTLRSAATTARTADQKAEEDKQAKAKLIKTENIGATYKAMLGEDPQAVFETFNASGTKLKEPPQIVERRKIKTPFGEIDDAVWSGVIVGEDGSETPILRSTQQVGMQLYDVKDLLKDGREAQKMGLQHSNALELEGVKAGRQDKPPAGWRWSADGTRHEFIPGGKADPANKRDGPSTMERMLNDSRRKDYANEEVNAKKEANQLRGELESGTLRLVFKSGNTKDPRWPEVQKAMSAIAEAESRAKDAGARKAEYDQALDSMTREVQGLRQPGLSDVRPPQGSVPAASQGAATPVNRSLRSTTAEMDVPKILGEELRKAMASASTDRREAANVAAIQKEIERLPKSQQQVALAAAGAQPSAGLGLSATQPRAQAGQAAKAGQPVAITSKAEHAALPRGTRYIDSSGNIAIKK